MEVQSFHSDGQAIKHCFAAIESCKMLRSSERLLASACFYSEASAIREQRERIERCSVQSVDDGEPDHGEYSPKTIKAAVDEAMKD